MGARMFRKGLAVAVILLFIGVAFAPSINASVVDDELVEFDVEFSGLGKKHRVQLTQQEADEVELLFDDIEQRLSEVETREEAELIFKDAIVELDKYGLLGGLSIKQAQQLIVGSNVRQNLLKRIDRIDRNILDWTSANYFCLVTGHLSSIATQRLLLRRCEIFLDNTYNVISELNNWDLIQLWWTLMEILYVIQSTSMAFSKIADFIFPISFLKTICAGGRIWYIDMSSDVFSSQGSVTSYGLSGLKLWGGSLWGVASTRLYNAASYNYCPALLGFIGLILTEGHNSNLLGFALKVDLSNEQPEWL